MNIKKLMLSIAGLVLVFMAGRSNTFERIPFGNFDNWLSRNIKESKLLGGKTKTIYEIAPAGTDNTGAAYKNRGGSPWATSNVLAKPAGVAKASNAVYPEERAGHGKCARLVCEYDHCRAVGVVNIEVIVGGSIFTGDMIEPIKNTKNPYSKMNMGMPFTRRPKALRFDYKYQAPPKNEKIYSSGFGKKKTIPGADNGETMVILQRRWEDKDGNIFAERVGTARERYSKTTGWQNGHDLLLKYGVEGKSTMDLIPKTKSYYARNSKGKMVPVVETGWDMNNSAPTHAIVMFSAASGEPYIGSLGLTLWVDNVGWVY